MSVLCDFFLLGVYGVGPYIYQDTRAFDKAFVMFSRSVDFQVEPWFPGRSPASVSFSRLASVLRMPGCKKTY